MKPKWTAEGQRTHLVNHDVIGWYFRERL